METQNLWNIVQKGAQKLKAAGIPLIVSNDGASLGIQQENTVINNAPKNITEATYKEFWDGIKVRVEALKIQDSELQYFGAKHHQYRIKPCLSEEDITKFEEKNALQLPEDYRTYLKFFGDGGAGPHYGVIPLKQAACESFPLEIPFKFTLPYFPDVEADQFFEFDHKTRTTEYFFTSREALIEAIYGTEEAYQKATNYVDEKALDAFTDEQFKEYQAFTKYGGILWLCEEGCGHISFLVVRGQEYGAMWGDSTVSDYGIFPHTKKGDKTFKTRLSFAEWFSEWLEKGESSNWR